MTKETPRRQARELALQALYAWEIGELTLEEIEARVICDDEASEKTLEYARELFRLTCRDHEKIDVIITELAHNWKVSRMASVDRNILRLAITEMAEMPDVPVKVVINEAIEMSKKFSTAESSSFVNGILDRYIRNLSRTGS
ncbi:MAG: transcription antitermination factor NusB [candidate division Zixibacteria bacterium]|nr:transcription antitermination factor NusB [candidate division Zixibacteria bacterium]